MPKTINRKTRLFSRIHFALDKATSKIDDCGEALDSRQEFELRKWDDIRSQLESQTSYIHFVQENPEYVYKRTYSEFADRAYTHKIHTQGHKQSIPAIMFRFKLGKTEFEGACNDDGTQKSCAGLKAYRRYFDHTRATVDLISGYVKFRLGGVVQESIGSTVIILPINSRVKFLEYYTHNINVDLDILFRLENMKKHQYYVNEALVEFISYNEPTLKVNLKLKLGHLYLEQLENLILFTRSFLLCLHGRFAHPTPKNYTS